MTTTALRTPALGRIAPPAAPPYPARRQARQASRPLSGHRPSFKVARLLARRP